jgi:hypothetical protein
MTMTTGSRSRLYKLISKIYDFLSEYEVDEIREMAKDCRRYHVPAADMLESMLEFEKRMGWLETETGRPSFAKGHVPTVAEKKEESKKRTTRTLPDDKLVSILESKERFPMNRHLVELARKSFDVELNARFPRRDLISRIRREYVGGGKRAKDRFHKNLRLLSRKDLEPVQLFTDWERLAREKTAESGNK